MYKHELIFHSLGQTEPYRITEPIGFDGATFGVIQDAKRYGRDVEFGALDKIDFVDAVGEFTGISQVINRFGDVSEFLDYGLQWLLYGYELYGFEFKVEYFVNDISKGLLDFTEKNITDGYSFMSCKLIQNSNVADLKRRTDDKFNAFSTVDVNGETITPAPTFNVLHRALPIYQQSKWKYGLPTPKTFYLGSADNFNFANAITEFGIRNTLSYIQGAGVPNDFKYVKAINELTDVKVEITNMNVKVLEFLTVGNCRLIYRVGQTIATASTTVVQQRFAGQSFDSSITFNIPIMQRGDYLWIYFRIEGGGTGILFSSMDIKIGVTSTAIDVVQKGMRWIDLMKQSIKYVNNTPVNASLFDVGGVHYDNIVFNKQMMTQRTENLTTTQKVVLGSLEEVNCDYEMNQNEIFIGHESDFYTNTENGVFNILPSQDYFINENEKVSINKFKFAYKNYEQERTTEGTNQAIHTEAEFRLLNKQVENVKDIKIDFVRDPLMIETSFALEIAQPTTITADDDKIFIQNIIPIAPSSFGTWGKRLTMRIVEGVLEILNKEVTDEESDVAINWLILGFSIGSIFEILEGENIGTYSVLGITSTVLRLTPITGTADFTGDNFIRVKYFYTNVNWVTRTNEGFSLVQNLDTLKFGNLAYSIKRNIKYFGQYLKACLLYSRQNILLNEFKNNGEATTQLNSETIPLVEQGTITFDSLPDPLINAKMHNLSLYADFDMFNAYLEQYQISRGFLRCLDIKGRVLKLYPVKVEHSPSTNELKIVAEQRFETEYLMITSDGAVITVNDAQYNLSGVSNWWIFNNDFIRLYDENSIAICNDYKYNFVNLNGIIYETKEELINALNAITL